MVIFGNYRVQIKVICTIPNNSSIHNARKNLNNEAISLKNILGYSLKSNFLIFIFLIINFNGRKLNICLT